MRRVILTLTSTVVGLVLLLSFKTHTGVTLANRPVAVGSTSTGSTSTGSTSTGSTSTGSTSTGSAPAQSPATRTATTASRTVTGKAVDTRYGPVQVQVTARNGVITNAQAVEYPKNSGRDEQINAYAVPVLNQEAQAADNASIDMVSGATYTSTGYIQSLQSALDQLT